MANFPRLLQNQMNRVIMHRRLWRADPQYFLRDPFRDGEAIPASIDKRPRAPDKYSEVRGYWIKDVRIYSAPSVDGEQSQRNCPAILCPGGLVMSCQPDIVARYRTDEFSPMFYSGG